MKLADLIEANRSFTPEQQARAEKGYKKLLMALAHVAPGPFKPVASVDDPSPFYMTASSKERGSMEVNLIGPDSAHDQFYVYIKAKHLSEKDQNELSKVINGLGLNARFAATGNALHVEVYLEAE